jgi:hypothetical protein
LLLVKYRHHFCRGLNPCICIAARLWRAFLLPEFYFVAQIWNTVLIIKEQLNRDNTSLNIRVYLQRTIDNKDILRIWGSCSSEY